MSDTIIQQALLKGFEKAGTPARFMPADGDPIDCLVDICQGVTIEEGGFDAPVLSRVNTLEYLIFRIGREAVKEEWFLVGDDEWVVEGPFEDPGSNDGYCAKVIVRKAA